MPSVMSLYPQWLGARTRFNPENRDTKILPGNALSAVLTGSRGWLVHVFIFARSPQVLAQPRPLPLQGGWPSGAGRFPHGKRRVDTGSPSCSAQWGLGCPRPAFGRGPTFRPPPGEEGKVEAGSTCPDPVSSCGTNYVCCCFAAFEPGSFENMP